MNLLYFVKNDGSKSKDDPKSKDGFTSSNPSVFNVSRRHIKIHIIPTIKKAFIL